MGKIVNGVANDFEFPSLEYYKVMDSYYTEDFVKKLLNENEKLKKENQLLKEQVKIIKEDVTAIYQEMISLDIIQKVETDDDVELL